jgi:phosphoglucosamine mutase
VRPSGTEPKIRIMVEGEDADEINQIARELSELARARLN